MVSFELIVNTDLSRGGPQSLPSLVEGDTFQNFISIQKTGHTNFAYNVTLKVEALTELSGRLKIN